MRVAKWVGVSVLMGWIALAGAVHAAEPVPLKTKISAVTVYADRAQVTRTGSVDLEASGQRVVLPELPGWIDPESVRATMVPASAGKILDVSVDKSLLVQANDDSVRKAETAVRDIQDELGALSDEERVLNQEIAQLEAIRAFSMDKLPKDMLTRDVKVKTFGETIDFVSEALRKDRKALRDLQKKKRALEPELASRVQKQEELRSRAQLEQSTITVELSGDGRATLQVTYLIAGATWEPVGELRVSKGGQAVSLVQFGSVVQTTGEDWEGAALSFATQRPDETLAVPEVQALLLGEGGGLGEVLGKMDDSFNQARSSYSNRNMIVGKGSVAWQQNVDNQMVVEQRASETFRKLAQRGTTAHFAALTPRVVRADGKPVRVPITTSEFTSELRVVAVPEVSLNAVRTASIKNTADKPILPGKLALFVDGAFIGTTELEFVAPGETFSTFLGVHDRVKLTRQLDRKKSAIERKKSTTRLTVSYEISVENLDDSAVTIELGDRVPVAQLDDIEIDDVKVPEAAKRDRDGVVKWTAQVPAKKKVTWRIEYRLEYPNDLLSKAKNRSKAPMPAPQQKLYEDIERYEKML
jgi:uncharacterized protein (TIGR02231 family)